MRYRKPTRSRRIKSKNKSKIWPTDITDMFGDNRNKKSSLFGIKNSKKDSASERIFEDNFEIEEFLAEEFDELSSPKLKYPFIPPESKHSMNGSRKSKNTFSFFPKTMLPSNNILKKTSELYPSEETSLNGSNEDDVNSYLLPSEDTYKSYDIPHHAKKRFSDFGSLVGFGRNRRQGHQNRGGSRSSRLSNKKRHSVFPEKKDPSVGFSTSKLRPPPVQRYPTKHLGGSTVKHPASHWSSHKVSLKY